jgi:hypothetical protein
MCYQRLIAKAGPYAHVLKTIVDRSAVINHPHRITGNAIIWIVDEIMSVKGEIDRNELQDSLDRFIESQTLIPGRWRPISPEETEGTTLKCRLLRSIQHDLEECKETV